MYTSLMFEDVGKVFFGIHLETKVGRNNFVI